MRLAALLLAALALAGCAALGTQGGRPAPVLGGDRPIVPPSPR